MIKQETIKHSNDILSLCYYYGDLSVTAPALKYLQETDWSNVNTKMCKSGDWKGLSLMNFSGDKNDLSKPNVLDADDTFNTICDITDLWDVKEMRSLTDMVMNFEYWRELNDNVEDPEMQLERVRLLKLEPNKVVKKHTDKVDKDFLKDYPLRRFHIPIKTNHDAFMTVYGEKEVSVNMRTHHIYYVDVTKPHSVVNGNDERIHLVIDAYVNYHNFERLCNLPS